MLGKIFLSFVLFISTSAWANEYSYQADVKGMVCAFCAYNVSKNISAMPGVDADSIDVDLQGGFVAFSSSQAVSENKLAALFTDSGFTLSNLRSSESDKASGKSKNTKPVLVLEFDRTKIEAYNSALEAIGNIVTSIPSHLLIHAPEEDEKKLLQPILMGRQQVIKVRYIPEEVEMIRILLFDENSLLD
jgi:copper chaperone CopZ